VSTNIDTAKSEADLVGMAVTSAFVSTRYYYLEQDNTASYYFTEYANCINDVTMANRATLEQNIFNRAFSGLRSQFDPLSTWDNAAVTAMISQAQLILPANATEVPTGVQPALASVYAGATFAVAVAAAEAAGGIDFNDGAMSALTGSFLSDPANPDASALATTFTSNGGVSCRV
jgi:hypothetical protein